MYFWKHVLVLFGLIVFTLRFVTCSSFHSYICLARIRYKFFNSNLDVMFSLLSSSCIDFEGYVDENCSLAFSYKIVNRIEKFSFFLRLLMFPHICAMWSAFAAIWGTISPCEGHLLQYHLTVGRDSVNRLSVI